MVLGLNPGLVHARQTNHLFYEKFPGIFFKIGFKGKFLISCYLVNFNMILACLASIDWPMWGHVCVSIYIFLYV